MVDSRDASGAVKRRRRCANCGARFTTFERVEITKPLVVKRDNTREEWSRAKLLEGVRLACTKRPISSKSMESVVDEVEEQLASTGRSEVSSREIGEAVMRLLRPLDEVAYIRFASVYLRFPDVNGFIEEAERVRTPPKPPEEQIPMNI